jgi:hypothetical protein
MKNTKDLPIDPSSWDDALDDTTPSLPIPPELRAKLAEEQRNDEPEEAVHPPSYDEPTLTQQDEIATPPPLTPPRGVTPRRESRPRSSAAMRIAVALALIISLASLALNAALIYALLQVRAMAADGLDSVIEAVDNFDGQGFHYDYRFEQVIPFSGDIPFKQDLVFPFEGDIPFNSTVEVPIDLGVQTLMIKVPINTSVYVDTEVPVSIDQTIHVDTSLPISMTIPIDIKSDDPMIQGLLDDVKEWLMQLRESF